MKALLAALFLFVFSSTVASADSFKQVAAYVKEYKKLPPEYITKQQAIKLGWVSHKGNLWEVAPGKIIGGDKFLNAEGRLPNQRYRRWFEADIDYKGGYRNANRLIYSNDGLFYKTTDHYKTFKVVE